LDFLAAAQNALANDLDSVVLFGSGAEGCWRPTSDVNVVIVLSVFEKSKVDQLREPLAGSCTLGDRTTTEP